MGGITSTINKVKYIGIACLTIAILSTLILNIISSYSSSKVNSNAEPATQSTNGTLVSGPASISLSLTPIITPTSSQCDTSNSNICMSIPDGGGIATGGHTVEVNNTSITGKADLALTSSNADWALESDNHSDFTIRPISLDPVLGDPSAPLADATWGIALFTPNNPDINSSLTDILGDEQNFIDSSNNETRWFPPSVAEAGESFENSTLSSINFYYGVYIDDPLATPAGNYSIDLIYTATVMLPESPVIDGIAPSGYELNSSADSAATITGTNLASTYKVYLESDVDTNINYDLTNSITRVTDDEIKVTLPTDKTNPELEPGNYTIHVVTQGTDDNGVSIPFTYTEKQLPAGMQQSTADYGSDGHVAVDYDENMIPITYTGNETTPKWVIADTSNSNSDTNLNWYDYPNKKWANAVTLTEEGLSLYKGKPVGTELDEQYVLGYWVYIPRYAYKVMRKEVADKVVTDEVAKNNGKGGFEIVFETNNDIVKKPAICNSSNANQYYQDCIKNQYGEAGIDYPGNNESLKNKTAWATHPAFTWQYTQEINGFDMTYGLNGIWVGKFETTGSTQGPTILPNRKHMSRGYSGNNGDLYDIAKSMGTEDPNNKYGNTTSTDQSNQNNNNLAISTSHMLKNGEWGAVAYLASSKYGASINNVQMNTQYQLGGDDNGDSSYGITGCGPTGSGSTDIYTGTGALGANTACSINDISRSYNGSRGVLASTTNNVYGVYDMNGGAYEYVMGSYTTNAHQSSIGQFANAARPPYVDLYYSGNGFPSTSPLTGNDYCTWSTCGGQALHETRITQSVMGPFQAWNQWDKGYSYFVYPPATWFLRGGYADDGSFAGIFTSNNIDGVRDFGSVGFRVTLIAN